MLLFKCLKIFLARIADVSLGTLKTVSCVKGKIIEPFTLAFFEVLIWYFIAREVLNTEGNTFLIAIVYALGYATGTLVGSLLSKLLIKGDVGVQVVLKEGNNQLIKKLRKIGYSVSIIELKDDYEGKNRDMLFIEVNAKRLKELTKLIKNFDHNAFIVVNDTKLIKSQFVNR